MSFKSLLVLSSVLAAMSAQASLTVYQGYDLGASSGDARPNADAAAAAFDAAAGTTSLYDFENAPVGQFSSLTIAPGATLTGTDINSNNQEVRDTVYGTPDNIWGYNTTAGGRQFGSFFGGTMTVTYSTAAKSFGAYLSGMQVFGSVTFNLADGSSQSVAVSNDGQSGGVEFLGATSSVGISSVRLDGTFDIAAIDDIRSGEPVPEPATMAALGLGLAAVARRRKRA